MGHPAADQGSGTGGGVRLSETDGLRPLGEAVHDVEQMFVAMKWRERGHKVNMQVVEATAGDLDLAERSMDVPLDLGTLTGEALLGPGADLLVQAVPDELGGYQPSGGVDSRVREGVDGVEHFVVPGHRHHGTVVPGRGVAQQRGVCGADRDVLDGQVCDGRGVGEDL